jgi:putative SOS response-associated peptidase YedK
VRGKEEGEHRFYAILTTAANTLTSPIHAEAMPVMLTGDDLDLWLEGSAADAMKLARPFPPERMRDVLWGPREDDGLLNGDQTGATGSLI